ncbi:MAG TPA: PQQ-binding-like beta-propeller repeat protein [Acidobacteriota bacterium]|nr:PQQ-binding-like beta-propeller repeat protein [Acidobacteriota bacterium]
MMYKKPIVLISSLALLAAAALAAAVADDIAMFGGGPSRNMISEATGLPANLDPDGPSLLWRQELGSQAYGGPVLADGVVYVGTNNEAPRDPAVTGDKGVVMAFNAADGEFLWQIVHDKLPEGRVHDWPLQGVCSGPAVEGDRLWYVSNQAHLVAADVQGLKDGNDGPFTEEKNTGDKHGDILWSLDMINELDVFPHNLAAGNPLVVGDLVFTVTGNGVDEGHINLPSPFAPSFIAVNKNTGELVWEDASPGTKILHGSWSNPAYGVAGGKEQVVFPGGDGWLYSFEPKTGKLIWKFDCNPKDSKWVLGGAGTRNNIISTPVFYNDRVYVGVGQDPEHGEGPGNFWVIDATGEGDVTGKNVIWHRGGDDFHRTMSTAAIKDGILYIADLSGFLYALDADSGEELWQHDVFAAVWGSAFVADGKVYLGDEDGDVVILKHGREKEVIDEFNLANSVYTTPVAEDGVLYVASRTHLFAFKTQ